MIILLGKSSKEKFTSTLLARLGNLKIDFKFFTVLNADIWDSINRDYTISEVYLLGLEIEYSALLKFLPEEVELNWIYYGYEFHGLKNRLGYDRQEFGQKAALKQIVRRIKSHIKSLINYQSYDDDILRLMKRSDFLLFWNAFEYSEVKNFVGERLKWKYFSFGKMVFNEEYPQSLVINKERRIIVNNSASVIGNHDHLLQIIRKNLDASWRITLPISYGGALNAEGIKKNYATLKDDGYRIDYLVEFISPEAYSKLYETAYLAVFGARRQHAGGSIVAALFNGCSVVGSEHNSNIRFYKSLGCSVLFIGDMPNKANEVDAYSSQIIQKMWNEDRIVEIYKSAFASK